jgi:uncharacterized protein
VRHVKPGLLGAAVGGLILITNTRTMFDAFSVSSEVRGPAYLALAVLWLAALALVVRRHRRSGEPLFERPRRREALGQTG